MLDSRCRRPNAKNHSDAIDDDSQRLKTKWRIGHWVLGVLGILGAALAERKGRLGQAMRKNVTESHGEFAEASPGHSDWKRGTTVLHQVSAAAGRNIGATPRFHDRIR